MILLCAYTAGGAQATSCSFSLDTGLTFPAYDVFSALDSTASGQISFSCDSDDVPMTLDFDAGAAGRFDPRAMSGPATDVLTYNIYMDAMHSQVWGDTTGGTTHFSGTTANAGTAVLLSYYGVLFARQDVATGSYTDTVDATLDF